MQTLFFGGTGKGARRETGCQAFSQGKRPEFPPPAGADRAERPYPGAGTASFPLHSLKRLASCHWLTNRIVSKKIRHELQDTKPYVLRRERKGEAAPPPARFSGK